MHLGRFRRLLPIVDLNCTDYGGPIRDKYIFRFMSMCMPGPYKARGMIGDQVESLYQGEVEIIYERELTSIIHSKPALYEPRRLILFFHLLLPHTSCVC